MKHLFLVSLLFISVGMTSQTTLDISKRLSLKVLEDGRRTTVEDWEYYVGTITLNDSLITLQTPSVTIILVQDESCTDPKERETNVESLFVSEFTCQFHEQKSGVPVKTIFTYYSEDKERKELTEVISFEFEDMVFSYLMDGI